MATKITRAFLMGEDRTDVGGGGIEWVDVTYTWPARQAGALLIRALWFCGRVREQGCRGRTTLSENRKKMM